MTLMKFRVGRSTGERRGYGDDHRSPPPPPFQVHADVESRRFHGIGQHPDGEILQGKKLQPFLGRQIPKATYVAVGNDHEVTSRVGIAVHHDKPGLSLADDQCLFPKGIAAKDTAGALLSPPDIGHAPWREDRLHHSCSPVHSCCDYSHALQKDKDFFGPAPARRCFGLTFRTGVD